MSVTSAESIDYLPYFAQGTVVKGFGRGSSELGIPTANFQEDVIRKLPDTFACGVYHGWACLDTLSPHTVYKMVMCVGWNPHYQNTVKTMETHIIHKFNSSFYGENLRIIILGYVRPMRAFDSLDSLIIAMNEDIRFAESALDEPSNFKFRNHPFLLSPKCPATNGMTPSLCTYRDVENGPHGGPELPKHTKHGSAAVQNGDSNINGNNSHSADKNVMNCKEVNCRPQNCNGEISHNHSEDSHQSVLKHSSSPSSSSILICSHRGGKSLPGYEVNSDSKDGDTQLICVESGERIFPNLASSVHQTEASSSVCRL